MLIVVEGADGVGKSTLVQRLADELTSWTAVEVLKAGPPRGHPLDEYVLPLLGYRPSFPTRRTVICDRWHLGELVYPTVLDRPTQLTDAAFRYVEMFLAARGAVVVHVDDTATDLERVLVARGDDLVRPEQAKLMLELFVDAVGDSVLPVINAEAHDTSPDTVHAIVAQAHLIETTAARLSDFVTYVGPPRPRHLLVGDVRGGDPSTHGVRPAFMPYPNSCGEYLLRAITSTLPRLGTARRLADVGIVNANDVDGLHAVWSGVGRPPVVALGRRAEREVARALSWYARTNPLFDVPHPQFWKRFHYDEYEAYGKMITGSWET